MLFRKSLAMLAFAVLIILPPVSTMARTITVDEDGPADYPTIEAAVNAATGGDTIFVKAGTYYECHIFPKGGVPLIGKGADVTKIVGRMEYFWTKAESPWKCPFIVYVDRQAQIEGFTLTWEADEKGTGALLHGLLATIRRCKVVGCYIGVSAFLGTGDPLIQWPVIEGNLITDNNYGVVWSMSAGSAPALNKTIADHNWWGTAVELEIKAGFKNSFEEEYPEWWEEYYGEETFKGIFYPWLEAPVDLENFKGTKELLGAPYFNPHANIEAPFPVGLHYNNIYGNEVNFVYPWGLPKGTWIEPSTWGQVKSKMK